ncbi:nitrate reductase molybdenum cofactor assembly chaperone [Tepidibacillus sp. HK-1]|uniref:nitrate reductase molybdenum cofactor assembly chaperone n=1 Tax=Tepidibacillus sp. HK-1 TaxID=1883407 RepID=UPI000853996F|nr:nitrate reductase molybdenum cofactor assembly chaperone [Tepidibacillus sp. HK-1]GBF11153.1 nitrate reductase molybdenum cofactor assembly chaperone NarJ [Tepidibacillus sp. HK-1]
MGNRELLHLISILLQYPDQEWFEADFESEIAEVSDLNPEIYQKLTHFLAYLKETDADELRNLYVQTFDFNEKTNLYLSYSKMKEERERGVVLVELKQFYEQAGLVMETEELPDYLPLFLEFIAIADQKDISKLLPPFQPAIEKVRDELIEVDSPYANLIEASLMILNQILPNHFVE